MRLLPILLLAFSGCTTPRIIQDSQTEVEFEDEDRVVKYRSAKDQDVEYIRSPDGTMTIRVKSTQNDNLVDNASAAWAVAAAENSKLTGKFVEALVTVITNKQDEPEPEE